ncbi:hypothetical protein H6G97_29185 [Nostoc flagelliforme FACHB-838]|uniref:Uncharacterized protein n=1 Tax=Nostoc flagelliforme FACHB-838 TaxID=2692904 RepID=A0ABR8DVD7_9NOSO|nr:hypothetical protein [Nostoc flagelliforme]MBD2533417.1 hypothetical protein [Nostoc flagelliforme FACHB-838]
MQIIQSPLGNNIHPLGAITSLSHPQKMLLRKDSPYLNSQSNFVSLIQSKRPLVTSSKFLLSRKYEQSIQPLIGWHTWDTQDINSDFTSLELDSFDSRILPEDNNINTIKSVNNSTQDIQLNSIDNNTAKDTQQEINPKDKSKSRKTSKSQKPPEKKSKSTSKTKKTVKSSLAKNASKFVDDSNIDINLHEDKLLVSDEPLPVQAQANLKLPTLQLEIDQNNNINDWDDVNSVKPIVTASDSPIIQEQSALFNNIANDSLQLSPELPSSLSSPKSSLTKSILPSQKEITIDNNTNDVIESSLGEFPLHNNVDQGFFPHSNFTDNEQPIITDTSESVNISNIPLNPTLPQQDIETYSFPSVVDNQISPLSTNLIQKKDVSPSLTSPSPEGESPDKNINLETIKAIEPDLISESIASDFITDNAVVDNSLPLLSAFPSPNVDDAPTLLHSLGNDQNTVGTHGYSPLPDVAAPNYESSIVKSPITIQQEIDSNVLSEFPVSTPVELTPTSADVEGTPNLFKNSDSKEQLVTLESQSAMRVNVSDVLANVTSLEHDSNVENTTSESTEIQPILAPPEIGEAPTITATSPEIGETAMSNDKPLGLYAPIPATSPEIGEPTMSNDKPLGIYAPLPEISEAPTITTISPEIVEPAMSNDQPLGVDAPLTATSPEIGEAPTITTISPEIVEPAMSNDQPLGVDAPLTATSPEIVEPAMSNDQPLGVDAPLTATSFEISETPTITTISPEIVEPAMSNDQPLGFYTSLPATSPEIGEAPPIPATSPEIGEAAMSNDKPLGVYTPLLATSPEIGEAPTITTRSPDIGETASIFRQIIDNEQTVESEFPTAVTNPEISTFVDTSDNPTSLQNEVSTVPEVEQNAIAENLPAPKGYATGGHVTASPVENRQQIASSDTVPAMLTPGEFVINTRDAQKNLPLLHHINTGGTPHDIILPSLQTPNAQEPEETTSPETPTKVDSFSDTSLQLKSAETDSPQISNSLIPSSLGLNISRQKLSILNSPQLNPLENETSDIDEPSPQYSSPPLIFRKANPTTNTSSQWSNTPSQWSSVEDLLNGNNDEFTSFNFSDMESNSQNYEFSHVSESPQIFAKHLPAPRGFADGGEVTPPDISREIQPVTETIESTSLSPQKDDKDDAANLEALAREIYTRLRQRIEIERERHGGYSGRLPW